MWEPFELLPDPLLEYTVGNRVRGQDTRDRWGTLITWPEGQIAGMPHVTEDDKVLIAEACSHHAQEGDIARAKLPDWLRKKVGPGLTVDIASGPTFPDNLAEYALILHCGACMFTRKQLMSRLIQAGAANVPITNYGTAIAALNGMLERVVEMFPEVTE